MPTDLQRLKIAIECLSGVQEAHVAWRTTKEGRLHVVTLTDLNWPRRQWGQKADTVELALRGMMLAAARRLAAVGDSQ